MMWFSGSRDLWDFQYGKFLMRPFKIWGLNSSLLHLRKESYYTVAWAVWSKSLPSLYVVVWDETMERKSSQAMLRCLFSPWCVCIASLSLSWFKDKYWKRKWYFKVKWDPENFCRYPEADRRKSVSNSRNFEASKWWHRMKNNFFFFSVLKLRQRFRWNIT